MTHQAQGLAAAAWIGTRGEKWRAQLAGMEATLAPIDEPLLAALALDGPLRIADVACGGGGTTLAIARRAATGSVVHGFDIAPGLVELARGRVADARGIGFEVADIATARPPEAPYDRLASRFGVMFFDDPPAAFANLARWLAPRGRFAFAVWGPGADNPWTTVVGDVVSKLAAVPTPAPDAPGPARYADPSALLALLDRSGLAELEVRDWRGPLAIGGGVAPAAAADFALAAFGAFHELLAQAGGDALERARQSLTAVYARHAHGGVVRMDARVHVVTGVRV